MPKKVLIVEDDANIAELLHLYLEKEGFESQVAKDGGKGVELFRSFQPDLVLLDIMLPIMDGWSVLKKIREGDKTPVIMLTAKGETEDKVAGLEQGADDYIVKPFEMKELIARINAVLRRTEIPEDTRKRLVFDKLEINLDSYELTVDGKKFSGNAFYKTGLFCYHHGTIMVRVDKENVGRYLNVSQEKLRSKSVDSVKSRVANLTEYVPGLTVDDVKDALVRVFGEVYDLPVESFRTERIHEEELKAGIEKFASWEWQYGRRIPFQYEAGRKLPWGEILIQLDVVEGVVRQAAVWSDGLDTDFPRTAERLLAGTRYRSDEWDELPAMISDEREAEMMKDVIRCLKEDV